MAVAGAALAATSVESANVVGYQKGTTVDGFNFIAAPFSTVGYNTTDIQQIKLSDDGAGAIGWGGEEFGIWEGGPSVVEGSSFLYYDPTMDPNGEAKDYYWGDDEGNPVSYSIAAGQGVVIGGSADLDMSVAGQVPAASGLAFTSVEGFNFTGNAFPEEIDIQDIAISDDGAGAIGWGGEEFGIWEGGPSVVEGSSFLYYDPTMDPNGEAQDYYWGDDEGNPVTYSIAGGQGVVISCASDLAISIVAPYEASAL
ncbi:MAG: hypothetical protein IKH04_06295 [Kiritimatiellae bacterium]|nr:hypothetical protein [Kiritimatiellia bacterium]